MDAPGASVSALQGDWIIARVRPRNEQAVGERLTVRGFASYVPLVRRGRGTAERWVPVFTQYVFACGDHDDLYYACKGDPHVFDLIEVSRNARGQFVRELDALQQAITLNPDMGICDRLVVGGKVRVIRGPFMGAIGVLQHAGDKFKPVTHLVIKVDILQRGVEMEIDPEDVEPVDY